MARNKDYIPTEAEHIAAVESQKAYQAEHADPRHSYKATYTLLGRPYSEIVMAFTADEAERHVKQQCSMVGVYPIDITIEEA